MKKIYLLSTLLSMSFLLTSCGTSYENFHKKAEEADTKSREEFRKGNIPYRSAELTIKGKVRVENDYIDVDVKNTYYYIGATDFYRLYESSDSSGEQEGLNKVLFGYINIKAKDMPEVTTPDYKMTYEASGSGFKYTQVCPQGKSTFKFNKYGRTTFLSAHPEGGNGIEDFECKITHLEENVRTPNQ